MDRQSHDHPTTREARPNAPSWDGPHFRLFNCGTNHFDASAPKHAMFMDAMEPLGCWEYVLSGAIYYRLGDRQQRVEAGEALVSRKPDPGWMLRPVRDEPVRTMWVSVTGEPALRMFDYLHIQYGQIQRLPPNGDAVRLARGLFRLARQARSRPAHYWSEKTFIWLNTWWREAEQEHAQHGRPHLDATRPSRLISYAPRTIENFAEEMGYSRSHLTRKLTEQWKKSPGKVLREVRLNDAAELLRTTRLTVAEVGRKVGYKTSAGFCRAFSARFDTTPAKYRRQSSHADPPAEPAPPANESIK